jgi:hypothetical protein
MAERIRNTVVSNVASGIIMLSPAWVKEPREGFWRFWIKTMKFWMRW